MAVSTIELAPEITPRALRSIGFRAGVIAGVGFTLVMFGLRAFFALPSLPELAQNALLPLVPGNLFESLLQTFGFAAKRLLFLIMILFQAVVVGGLLGMLYARLFAATSLMMPREEDYPAQMFGNGQLWRNALLYAAGIWLVMMVAFMPLVGLGFFGVASFQGGVAFSTLSFIIYLSFSLLLAFFFHAMVQGALRRLHGMDAGLHPTPAPDGSGGVGIGRRQLLRNGLLGLAALGLGYWAWRYIVDTGEGSGTGGAAAQNGDQLSAAGLPALITPTDSFYKVSKNTFDPSPGASDWVLSVSGLVDHPFSIGYDDLKAMPAVEQQVTLQCISNEVGGNLISNGKWKGVRLADLLRRAGVQSGAVDVVFRARDGYSDSITVETAMHEYNLLAYAMNDAPLRSDHGAPARLLIPGIFGMKNVKWLDSIEVVNNDYKGFWQAQGWDDSATVRTATRIIVPESAATLKAGGVLIGGTAAAGDRGIRQVQISLDGGQTWQAAQITASPSPYSWVIWQYVWQATPGRYTIVARSIDGRGNLQESEYRAPYPSGATGYHKVGVVVT